MKKYVTNIENGLFLREDDVLHFDFNDDYEWNIVNIYPKLEIACWDGLGGAITEASSINYFKMTSEN